MSNHIINPMDFLLLLEAIKYECSRFLAKNGNRKLLKDKGIMPLYGIGDYRDSECSIRTTIYEKLGEDYLRSKGFKGEEIEQYSYSFSGRPLYNAKREYNKWVSKRQNLLEGNIVIKPAKYIDIYYDFLEIRDMEELRKKYEHLKVKTTSFDSIHSGGTEPILSRFQKELKATLEDSYWYLYSFNQEHQNMVRAILSIGKLKFGEKEHQHGIVKLINPPEEYSDYIGYVNLRYAQYGQMLISLEPEINPNKNLHLTFNNYYKMKVAEPFLFLGILTNFKSEQTTAYRVVMMKQESISNLKAADFDLETDEVPSPILRFLTFDRKNSKFMTIPKRIYSLSKLERYMNGNDSTSEFCDFKHCRKCMNNNGNCLDIS